MGVDTVIKWVVAALIIAALIAAVIGLASVVGTPGALVTGGLSRMSDTSGQYGWVDPEYQDQGAISHLNPAMALSAILANFYPGQRPFANDYSVSNGGWLVAMFVGLPLLIAAWLGVKYLTRFLL